MGGTKNSLKGSGGSQTLQEVSDTGGLSNGATLKQGTTNAGLGGNKGIALKCSLDYELKWEAGRLYTMEQDGFTIREVSHNFAVTPTVTDDDTKGFVVGSRWILDDGSVYLCVDATTGNALWSRYNSGTSETSNIFQGYDAGIGSTGIFKLGVGIESLMGSSGDYVQSIGGGAGSQQTGSDNNFFGYYAGHTYFGSKTIAQGTSAGEEGNGDNNNIFGYYAGYQNTFKNVNLFGFRASADADNQTVFSKWISGATKYLGRLSFNNITANRKWELPDADGTLLLEVVTQRSTATSGTISAADTSNSVVFIHEAGATATLTYEFPPNPIDKQRVTVMSVGGITTLTLTAAIGTIINTITTLASGGSATYMYLASQTKWYKIG